MALTGRRQNLVPATGQATLYRGVRSEVPQSHGTRRTDHQKTSGHRLDNKQTQEEIRGSVARRVREAGFEIEVLVRDITRHPSQDVLRWKDLDLQRLRRGYYQAFHSGFPCTTVSKALHKLSHMYKIWPLRSRRLMRGLPTNTPQQQRTCRLHDQLQEASVQAMHAILAQARRTGMATAGGLENPQDPGQHPYPSFWIKPNSIHLKNQLEVEQVDFPMGA